MAIEHRHIAECPGVQIIGTFNRPITGASIDSRSLRKGDLFIAFVGAHVDGHDFIPSAISRGASAVMASSTWVGAENWQEDLPLILSEDPETTLGHLARLHRQRFDIPVIAITGTNGKTTTKNLVAHILSENANVLATRGNYNNQLGLPLTLLDLTDEHDYAVLEMGASKPGDIAYLAEIAEPTLGLITSISAAHTEFLGDINGVIAVKDELFQYLEQVERPFLVNADDVRVARLARNRRQALHFGFKRGVDHSFGLEGPDGAGCYTVVLPSGGQVRLPHPGEPLAWNAAAAAAICLELGIEEQAILPALAGYPGEPGRMQRLEIKGVTVIHDAYNANPASFRASLRAFSRMVSAGRRILVFGDMLELGKISAAEHTACGEHILASGVDRVYLVGSETQNTAARLNGSQDPSWFHSEARKPAIQDFLNYIKPGDLVLLKGSRGIGLEHFIDALKERD